MKVVWNEEFVVVYISVFLSRFTWSRFVSKLAANEFCPLILPDSLDKVFYLLQIVSCSMTNVVQNKNIHLVAGYSKESLSEQALQVCPSCLVWSFVLGFVPAYTEAWTCIDLVRSKIWCFGIMLQSSLLRWNTHWSEWELCLWKQQRLVPLWK